LSSIHAHALHGPRSQNSGGSRQGTEQRIGGLFETEFVGPVAFKLPALEIPATSVLASLFQLPRKPSNDFTTMKPNLDKIDDAVLALLYLTSFTEGKDELALTRAWKGHDWDALDRLHKKGLISDPKKKAKSVVLSQEGRQLSEEVFRRLFCE